MSGENSPFGRPAVTTTLAALRGSEPRTLTELARSTGLSRPTVEDALTRLTDLRVVAELAPPRDGQKGRPARLYRFRPEAGAVLGLDIGEHRVAATVADLTGTTLATADDRVSATDSGDARLAAVRAVIRDALRDAGRSRAELWAAAAGTTGIVDSAGRVVLSNLLPDWTGRNLAGQLRRSLACPVLVENDANLAAVAEHWRGAAIGVDDVVYVHASHRLGAGILIGGRVHRGFSGAAGELSALRILQWDTAARHFEWPDRPVPADDLDAAAERIIAAARDGNRDAQATVRRFARDLAAGVAAMTSTVDPELVVIGGHAARGGDILLTPVADRVRELCDYPPRIAVSALDDDVVILGAVRTALDFVERQIFRLHPDRHHR